MEFTDWMLWKLGGLALIAFLYNFWRAATDRENQEDRQERRDK